MKKLRSISSDGSSFREIGDIIEEIMEKLIKVEESSNGR